MSNVGFMYIDISWHGRSATIRVTDEAFRVWELMSKDTSTWWPAGDAWRKGKWRSFLMPGVECLHQNGQPLFHLHDLGFPPQLGTVHPFVAVHGWVGADVNNLPTRTGTYEVQITEQLVDDAKKDTEAIRKALVAMGLELGIDFAAMVPGPQASVLSLAGAYLASERGDYLACALNLVAAVPFFGSILHGVQAMDKLDTLRKLAARLDRIVDLLKRFCSVSKSGKKAETVLNATSQGTTIVQQAVPLAEEAINLGQAIVKLEPRMLDMSVDLAAVARNGSAFKGFPRMEAKSIKEFLGALRRQGFRRVSIGKYDNLGKSANQGGSNIYLKFDSRGRFTGEAVRLDSRGHTTPLDKQDARIWMSGGKIEVGWGGVPHFHKEFIEPKNAQRYLQGPLQKGESIRFDDHGMVVHDGMDQNTQFGLAHCWLIK